MNDRLQAVVSEAAKLSEEEQAALAVVWEEALEEREWERIVAKPSVRGAFERMAAEALREDAAGETEDIEGDSFVVSSHAGYDMLSQDSRV